MQPQIQTATQARQVVQILHTLPIFRAVQLLPSSKPAPVNVPFICRHSRRARFITGSVFFSAGDVIDTVRTVSVCLDCGEEFPCNA